MRKEKPSAHTDCFGEIKNSTGYLFKIWAEFPPSKLLFIHYIPSFMWDFMFFTCLCCRAPTRCSWRWNWTAPNWRAGPSGSRGRWRRRSRRIKVTAKEPQGGPAGARWRARGGRGEAVEEVSSLQRNSLETSRGRPKAPPPSKERWWIQTKRLKRRDWRRKWSRRRLFISDGDTNNSVWGLVLLLSQQQVYWVIWKMKNWFTSVHVPHFNEVLFFWATKLQTAL